jgi:rhodanese-related sulfurtransferase
MPNDPFVDVAALSSLGPIRYLDARDQAMFDARHAPGAVHVPVDEWDKAAKARDVGFANTAYWDHALESLGVDPSALAVTYDGGQMTNAARVWFILQYFGIKAVILNGGWPALSGTAGLQAGAGPSGSVGLADRETLKRQLGARRMCSTPAPARSSLEKTLATVLAADISRAPGIYRTPICWTMASFVRHRRCEACWSTSDLVRAITSSPLRRRRESGVGRSRGGARGL